MKEWKFKITMLDPITGEIKILNINIVSDDENHATDMACKECITTMFKKFQIEKVELT